MTNSISNFDDIIDSRDVIERIEELRSEREDHEGGPEAWAEECAEDAEELAALEALNEEGKHIVMDWSYGAALIRETYFKDYAQELAEDIGAINRDAGWPACCIDWEQAARDLQMDYTAVEFGGVTYWIR